MDAKFQIGTEDRAPSCYFRSMVAPPNKKALLKITDRCNLSCAHCFVSAGKEGASMPIEAIRSTLVQRLVDMHVISATLTGGEPFAHPDIMDIVRELRSRCLDVSLCTNGTMISEEQIKELAGMGRVTANVSLDGFSPGSHGKFRGNPKSFHTTVETIEKLAKHGILKGLLVTPNRLAETSEYSQICEFAIENGAKYVLMNPLSSFGRGMKSKNLLESSEDFMKTVERETSSYKDRIELVPVRFPNDGKPLSSCHAGKNLYVFTNGDVSPCAYLSFAAKNSASKYSPQEFTIGNVFEDGDIAAKVGSYDFHDRYMLGNNPKCNNCEMGGACEKGCPAAVIASGELIGGVDEELCPK